MASFRDYLPLFKEGDSMLKARMEGDVTGVKSSLNVTAFKDFDRKPNPGYLKTPKAASGECGTVDVQKGLAPRLRQKKRLQQGCGRNVAWRRRRNTTSESQKHISEG